MRPKDVLIRRPVFTAEEFAEFLSVDRLRTSDIRQSLLTHHLKSGNILRIKQGLYATVPPGMNPESSPVDMFQIAGKMSTDAVLGYHTALDFYGKAHSIWNQFLYLTSNRATRPVIFRGHEFRGVLFPKALREKGEELFAVNKEERTGLEVRVTSLERTLVDLLDRPHLGGGYEEIWRSLEAVEFFDLDMVLDYALLLGNSTTIAKVGFFLETQRDELMVEEDHLRRLREHRPKRPTYMIRADRSRGNRKRSLVKAWNLVVPQKILNRTWEEIT